MVRYYICSFCEERVEDNGCEIQICPYCNKELTEEEYIDEDILPCWVEGMIDNGTPLSQVRSEFEYARNMRKNHSFFLNY